MIIMLDKKISYYTRKVAEYGRVPNTEKKNQYRFNRLLVYKKLLNKELFYMEKEHVPDKQVKISYEWHEKLRELAFEERKEMRQIVHEAIDLYIKNKGS